MIIPGKSTGKPLLVLGALLFFTDGHLSSLQAGTYTASAHGDSAAGVKRTELAAAGYARGNCAHCHEQHGTVGGTDTDPAGGGFAYSLFADNFDTSVETGPYSQSHNFCFYCHSTTGSVQEGGITNYDHSRTFGGITTGGPQSIMGAFNQLSYHDLYDIWYFSKNKTDEGFAYFTDYSNPCNACHNPHLVKRNRTDPDNPGLSVLARPTDHGNLWGDDDTERLDDYTLDYQAPYHYDSLNTYEPGGTTETDGSKTPDYVSFCLDCHQYEVYSTTHSRNLTAIDWDNEKHGKGDADEHVDMEAPYASGDPASVGHRVCSCTDCHEPHGSSNTFLLRREVNGAALSGTMTDTQAMGHLCRNCHQDDEDAGYGAANHWEYAHHYSNDKPYTQVQCGVCHDGMPSQPDPQPCNNCHSHGMSNSHYKLLDPSPRRTF